MLPNTSYPASTSAAPESSALPLAERPLHLRNQYEESLARQICALIVERGITHLKAGVLVGLRPESVRRWRRQYPDFNRQLAEALSEHRRRRSERRSSTPSAAPTADLPGAADHVGPGRPTLYSDRLVEIICAHVRRDGISDTHAAYLAGIGATTICMWKRTHPGFAGKLERARTEYLCESLDEIRNASTSSGTLDWRARAWLLERIFPQEFGRQPRRPSPDAASTPLTDDAASASDAPPCHGESAE